MSSIHTLKDRDLINQMVDGVTQHCCRERVVSFETQSLVKVFDRFVPLSHQTIDKSERRISRRVLWTQNKRLFMKIDGLFIFPDLKT